MAMRRTIVEGWRPVPFAVTGILWAVLSMPDYKSSFLICKALKYQHVNYCQGLISVAKSVLPLNQIEERRSDIS
jgi:hypothetical protein